MSTLSQLLGQIPAYDRPITLTRGSQQSGFDELGNPTFRDVMGRNFSIGAQPVQQQSAPEPVLRTILDDQGRAIHTREPAPQRSNPFSGIVDAITQGFTAPGRAARGEPVTFGDVVATAGDYGMLGAPMRAPAGALRAGAMRTADEAETPAAMVARMLREGRASEVTDDMMARVDPMEMFDLYEGGATGMPMPMDEASRMARASDMGFDPERRYYHGTNAEFSEMRPSTTGKIGPGVYMTDNPEFAGAFASDNPEMGGRILPLTAQRYEPVPDFVRTEARAARSAESDGFDGANAYSNLMRRYGYDGVEVQDQRTVLTPSNIRSRFARFDPRLSHLANLSAGAAGGAVTLQQLMSEPSADERALREYLQALQ